MSKETWKTIPEWPHYQVSDLGRVRSCHRHRLNPAGNWRILTQVFQKRTGYFRVTLCLNKVHVNANTHQLVACLFLPSKPSPTHEVNHKDGDKTNCKWDNLEWVTKAENARHAHRLGLAISPARRDPACLRRGAKHPAFKISNERLLAIRELVALGESVQRIADHFGLGITTVRRIITGERGLTE